MSTDDELQEVHELPKITGKIMCVHVLERRRGKRRLHFFILFSRVSGEEQSAVVQGVGLGGRKIGVFDS